jgi:hypothetical protein
MIAALVVVSTLSLHQAPGPTPQAAAPPSAPPLPQPCSEPIHRQFDFWLGRWDVVARGGFAGTNLIEKVDGGCALYESWSSGAGGYTGRSLNSVGSDGRWHQTWVDASGLRLELAGGLVRGSMVLEGDTPARTAGAPPVKNRIRWSPEPEGRVRQHWETSADGGGTWTTVFDGMYHPVRSAPLEKRSLLRRLAGGWIGTGSVLDRDSHVELTVTPVLGGRFLELRWVNGGGEDGRELFEGLAVYEEKADGTLAASWWDSLGARHEVAAAVEGAAITALWGDRGRTVYRLLETGELEVTDSVRREDGDWSEFGRCTLRRK